MVKAASAAAAMNVRFMVSSPLVGRFALRLWAGDAQAVKRHARHPLEETPPPVAVLRAKARFDRRRGKQGNAR